MFLRATVAITRTGPSRPVHPRLNPFDKCRIERTASDEREGRARIRQIGRKTEFRGALVLGPRAELIHILFDKFKS